jgi:sec-independent protein translocase protein TatC
MATAIRMIGHEERMTLVDHLDELRTRLIVGGLAFVVAFGLCFWQNSTLLHVINTPLEQQTRAQVQRGEGPAGKTWEVQHALRKVAGETEASIKILSAPGSGLSSSARSQLAAQLPRLKASVAAIPTKPEGFNPTTIGFGEPFTATITVTLYFALLLSLPVLLFQLYGFILPAFSPSERRVALPLLMAVPFLFVGGVVFGYFVVLPAAVHFFQNFNSGEFNVLVQGNSYYKFAAMMLIAMGLIFQVPVAVLGVTQAGIVTPKQLRKARRYALVFCALVAAILPGDVTTMVLETLPLYLLYELSVLLAAVLAKRRAARERRAAQGAPAFAVATAAPGAGAPSGGAPSSPAASAPGAAERQIDPQVREMLDHIDPDLHS